jgi:metal-responsive CopG/Arc/MetJ family transcriptional regulator
MKDSDVAADIARSGILVVRLPQDLIARIDDAAGRELLSRSALVRRTLNGIYSKPAEAVA